MINNKKTIFTIVVLGLFALSAFAQDQTFIRDEYDVKYDSIKSFEDNNPNRYCLKYNAGGHCVQCRADKDIRGYSLDTSGNLSSRGLRLTKNDEPNKKKEPIPNFESNKTGTQKFQCTVINKETSEKTWVCDQFSPIEFCERYDEFGQCYECECGYGLIYSNTQEKYICQENQSRTVNCDRYSGDDCIICKYNLEDSLTAYKKSDDKMDYGLINLSPNSDDNKLVCVYNNASTQIQLDEDKAKTVKFTDHCSQYDTVKDQGDIKYGCVSCHNPLYIDFEGQNKKSIDSSNKDEVQLNLLRVLTFTKTDDVLPKCHLLSELQIESYSYTTGTMTYQTFYPGNQDFSTKETGSDSSVSFRNKLILKDDTKNIDRAKSCQADEWLVRASRASDSFPFQKENVDVCAKVEFLNYSKREELMKEDAQYTVSSLKSENANMCKSEYIYTAYDLGQYKSNRVWTKFFGGCVDPEIINNKLYLEEDPDNVNYQSKFCTSPTITGTGTLNKSDYYTLFKNKDTQQFGCTKVEVNENDDTYKFPDCKYYELTSSGMQCLVCFKNKRLDNDRKCTLDVIDHCDTYTTDNKCSSCLLGYQLSDNKESCDTIDNNDFWKVEAGTDSEECSDYYVPKTQTLPGTRSKICKTPKTGYRLLDDKKTVVKELEKTAGAAIKVYNCKYYDTDSKRCYECQTGYKLTAENQCITDSSKTDNCKVYNSQFKDNTCFRNPETVTCSSGQTKIGNSCCDNAQVWDNDSKCCAEGNTVTDNKTKCCESANLFGTNDPKDQCCDNGTVTDSGTKCCANASVYGDNLCCTDGTVTDDATKCCPADSNYIDDADGDKAKCCADNHKVYNTKECCPDARWYKDTSDVAQCCPDGQVPKADKTGCEASTRRILQEFQQQSQQQTQQQQQFTTRRNLATVAPDFFLYATASQKFVYKGVEHCVAYEEKFGYCNKCDWGYQLIPRTNECVPLPIYCASANPQKYDSTTLYCDQCVNSDGLFYEFKNQRLCSQTDQILTRLNHSSGNGIKFFDYKKCDNFECNNALFSNVGLTTDKETNHWCQRGQIDNCAKYETTFTWNEKSRRNPLCVACKSRYRLTPNSDKSINTCVSCSSSNDDEYCLTYEKDTCTCNACMEGYYLNSSKRCVIKCSNGTPVTGNEQGCTACNDYTKHYLDNKQCKDRNTSLNNCIKDTASYLNLYDREQFFNKNKDECVKCYYFYGLNSSNICDKLTTFKNNENKPYTNMENCILTTAQEQKIGEQSVCAICDPTQSNINYGLYAGRCVKNEGYDIYLTKNDKVKSQLHCQEYSLYDEDGDRTCNKCFRTDLLDEIYKANEQTLLNKGYYLDPSDTGTVKTFKYTGACLEMNYCNNGKIIYERDNKDDSESKNRVIEHQICYNCQEYHVIGVESSNKDIQKIDKIAYVVTYDQAKDSEATGDQDEEEIKEYIKQTKCYINDNSSLPANTAYVENCRRYGNTLKGSSNTFYCIECQQGFNPTDPEEGTQQCISEDSTCSLPGCKFYKRSNSIENLKCDDCYNFWKHYTADTKADDISFDYNTFSNLCDEVQTYDISSILPKQQFLTGYDGGLINYEDDKYVEFESDKPAVIVSANYLTISLELALVVAVSFAALII